MDEGVIPKGAEEGFESPTTDYIGGEVEGSCCGGGAGFIEGSF